MWYFAWILGVLLAVSFGIINAMWLELNGQMDNTDTADNNNPSKAERSD